MVTISTKEFQQKWNQNLIFIARMGYEITEPHELSDHVTDVSIVLKEKNNSRKEFLVWIDTQLKKCFMKCFSQFGPKQNKHVV